MSRISLSGKKMKTWIYRCDKWVTNSGDFYISNVKCPHCSSIILQQKIGKKESYYNVKPKRNYKNGFDFKFILECNYCQGMMFLL